MTVLWYTITKTAIVIITYDNSQNPGISRKGFMPTAINQGDNDLFILSLTTDPCMTSDHYQIQHIKQSLGTNLTILSYLSYILLSTIYYILLLHFIPI